VKRRAARQSGSPVKSAHRSQMNDKRISVAYFTNAQIRGGAEEHILTLLEHLDRQRFLPHLIAPPALIERLQSDLPADVIVLPVFFELPIQLAEAWKLGSFLREKRIDILHSHHFRSSLMASPIARFCRVPITMETSHGRELWRKGRFFIDRFAGLFVDHYIAVSRSTAEWLIQQKGLPASKIHVICSASDMRRFDPLRPAPPGVKLGLGFNECDPVLLVAGRLEPQKGHRVLLDAMPLILQEFPQARLVCVSTGSLKSELEKRVADLGISDSVRFVGYQPDIRDWWALADLSVLPSFYEGLPLSAIESLAMECPIVATAVDGTPEVVLNEKTGLTVPPGDPKSLASAICQMLRDPAWAKQMARAGRQHVLNEFSIETLVKKTQQLYLHAWDRYLGTADLAPASAGGPSIPEREDVTRFRVAVQKD